MLDAKDSIGVVSVLEGGYSLAAPKQSTKDKKLPHQPATSSATTTRAGGRGSNTVPTVAAAPSDMIDLTRRYAQLPGDGGLVKRSNRFFSSGIIHNYFNTFSQCFGAHCSFGRLRSMDFLKGTLYI